MTKNKKAAGEKSADEVIQEEMEKETGGGDGTGVNGDEQTGSDAGVDGQETGEGREAEEAECETDDIKYLRLAADFQNYKRRTEKERFERYTEGKKDFASAMLPILDNFDRALAQDAADAEGERERLFIAGMGMILTQFVEALAANGVTEIPALGEDFDPNMHDAVVMEPSDKYGSQKVSEVLQKGYRIGDKVIRPVMVKVAE